MCFTGFRQFGLAGGAVVAGIRRFLFGLCGADQAGVNLERAGLRNLLEGEAVVLAGAGGEQRENEGGGDEQAHGVRQG